MMDTAIVIPAYNPDERLIHLVRELNAQGFNRMIVVNDGSEPQRSRIFEALETDRLCVVCIHPSNLGKGAALKTGLRESMRLWPGITGIVTADADGQHSPRDIAKVAAVLEANPKRLVLGVRNFSGSGIPAKSRMGNGITAAVFRLSTGCSCSDTQTGLRGLPVSKLPAWLELPGNRYEYEINLLLQAAKDKTPILETPIETIYLDNNKASHFNPWKDSALIYLRIARFGISSLVSAVLDIGAFSLLHAFVWPGGAGIRPATVAARIVSGGFNFCANRRWVFKGKGSGAVQACLYLLLFFALMFSSFKLVEALHGAGLNAMAAKLLTDSALFVASYFVQKKIIFRP